MSGKYSYTRVADPVHGTIGLSEVESRILDTNAFKRLRNIKQLGLAHYVYPSADYSRLSHSVGVCHLTGQILNSLRELNVDDGPDDREVQQYRLAGLLHDIGHYPFSHAMEHAIGEHFSGQLIAASNEGSSDSEELPPKWMEHERVGQEILDKDKDIHGVLEAADFKPDEIYSIFNREKPPRFANLVSSDLDADRIDYLLRTAHHTGLPYGSVDVDYLLSQLRVDSEQRVCISNKAIRTADHFLLCRMFDYQQIAFHKTVVGFEWLLKVVLQAMLQNSMIDTSWQTISSKIEDGTWHQFDDVSMVTKIREFAASFAEEPAGQKATAILNRIAPKLVWRREFLNSDSNELNLLRRLAKKSVPELAGRFGIDESNWHVWTKSAKLTKIGSHVSISEATDVTDKTVDDIEQAIRVIDTSSGKSKPIVASETSLMSILGDHQFNSVRIYVLLNEKQQELRGEIETAVTESMSE